MDALFACIDVSNVRLDVNVRPVGESFGVPSSGAGVDDLIVRLRALTSTLVAVDTPSGFEAVVTAGLAGEDCWSSWQPGASVRGS